MNDSLFFLIFNSFINSSKRFFYARIGKRIQKEEGNMKRKLSALLIVLTLLFSNAGLVNPVFADDIVEVTQILILKSVSCLKQCC